MPANDDLLDSALRHQVWLIRFGGARAREVLTVLDEAERELAGRLAAKLSTLPGTARDAAAQRGVERLRRLLADVKAQGEDLRAQLHRTFRPELIELAELEIDLASRRIDESIGVSLGNFRPSPEILRAIVDGPQARGKTLRQWFKRLTDERLSRIEGAVRVGLLTGDTTPAIISRVRKAEAITKRSAEALVRTSVNHVANGAREALYKANDDVVKAVRWVATLDSRTSPICRALDGKQWEIDEAHPNPPAHPNCRSTIAPVTKSWEELSGRNSLAPGRGARDIKKAVDRRLREMGMSAEQRAAYVARARSSMNGAVPNTTTYGEWLKRQPKEFQDDVLGRARAKLFREGGLTVDQFVDKQTGRQFTLAELRAREDAAWARAGMNR